MKKTAEKIAVIVNYFPTVSETFIVNQVNSLIELGFFVSLFAYNKSDISVLHDSFKKHGLLDNVFYFTKPPTSKIKRFQIFVKWIFQNSSGIDWRLFSKTLNVFKYGKEAYTLKLFFEAQWFLVPRDIELFHAHFGMVGNRIAYLKAKGILPESIKLITSFHGYDLQPNKLLDYKSQYKYLFERADAFTVNTPYLKNLLQQVNIKKTPCYILPVGLDTSFFKKTKIKERNGYFDIVFCGKFIPLKGPDLAIEIVKELHCRGYTKTRLHLIGDGGMKKHLEQSINAWKLQDAVFFYGKQSQKDLKNHFEQADIFIMPGRTDGETGRAETQGLVIQEAQAMELPVVVSDVGGMKYGLIRDRSGFVLEENNLQGFLHVIEQLILKTELRVTMGSSGRRFVVENYDNGVLVRKLVKIYEEV